jgi:hypothetical protein
VGIKYESAKLRGTPLGPIVIEDRDPNANLIISQWIECDARLIHEAACYLTRRLLGDVRLVSEVVRASIQTLPRRYGGNLGTERCKRVYALAGRGIAGNRRRESIELLLAQDGLFG